MATRVTPQICLSVLLAVVVALSGPSRAAAAGAEEPYDSAGAQAFVEQYAQRHGLPGAAYTVVRDGRPVSEGAVGGLTVDTPVSVASVSKSFTAFAVLQLVDQGEVDLDAAITRYLPDFTVRGASAEAITVRRLLSHTSGLPNPMIVPVEETLSAEVANVADLTVASEPGTDYLYSNLNYRTLALLVQTVSGQDFDAYLAQHIFQPLGMESTTSAFQVAPMPGLDAGHVTAYGLALRMPELRSTIAGAGGVVSTAHDMGRWLAMQQRGGTAADGTRLLSADLVRESHTVQPQAGTYGLGWQHTSTAQPPRVGHDGSLTRYSSRADLVPSSGYGVVVLLDSYTPTYQHPFTISTGLIELSEGGDPDVGAPVATIIDLVLGALTVGFLALGVRGLRRSTRWAERRAAHPAWRVLLRHTPQVIVPVLAVVLFLGLTTGNPATPLDTFGLWPAAMVLVLAGALIGVVLVAVRTRRWLQVRTH